MEYLDNPLQATPERIQGLLARRAVSPSKSWYGSLTQLKSSPLNIGILVGEDWTTKAEIV